MGNDMIELLFACFRRGICVEALSEAGGMRTSAVEKVAKWHWYVRLCVLI